MLRQRVQEGVRGRVVALAQAAGPSPPSRSTRRSSRGRGPLRELVQVQAVDFGASTRSSCSADIDSIRRCRTRPPRARRRSAGARPGCCPAAPPARGPPCRRPPLHLGAQRLQLLHEPGRPGRAGPRRLDSSRCRTPWSVTRWRASTAPTPPVPPTIRTVPSAGGPCRAPTRARRTRASRGTRAVAWRRASCGSPLHRAEQRRPTRRRRPGRPARSAQDAPTEPTAKPPHRRRRGPGTVSPQQRRSRRGSRRRAGCRRGAHRAATLGSGRARDAASRGRPRRSAARLAGARKSANAIRDRVVRRVDRGRDGAQGRVGRGRGPGRSTAQQHAGRAVRGGRCRLLPCHPEQRSRAGPGGAAWAVGRGGASALLPEATGRPSASASSTCAVPPSASSLMLRGSRLGAPSAQTSPDQDERPPAVPALRAQQRRRLQRGIQQGRVQGSRRPPSASAWAPRSSA